MAEESSGAKVSWIARYGVPSIILSVAVFMFQQQQQTFDRLQRMLEGGYGFYANGKTTLSYSEDPEREIALLRIIGNVFPNVFCDVRMDMYLRSTALRIKGGQDKDGRKLLESDEQKRLWTDLLATDTSSRTPAPANLAEAWTLGRKPVSCEEDKRSSILAQSQLKAPLDGAPADSAKPGDAKVAEAAPAAPPPPAASETAPPAAEATRTAEAGPAPSPATSGAPSTRPGGGGGAGRATADPAAPPPPVSTSQPGGEPEMRPAQDGVRITYHMPSNSKDEREAFLVDKTRAFLTDHGYQVVRSIERVPPTSFPSNPEVRYFGSQQADEAEQLVKYLNWYLRDEGLKFRMKAIGKEFPVMPQGNIEVWVPSPVQWLKTES